MAESGEGVGVERAVAGGESGDGVDDAEVGGGGPGGVANILPEMIAAAEGEELGGSAAGGGESGAVEPVQNMGLNDVRVDAGEWGGSAVIGVGGGGGIR